jgi:hypothetical protein
MNRNDKGTENIIEGSGIAITTADGITKMDIRP